VTSTAAIPVYGKLSDFFGRKPMLLIGIVLFLIGSVLSGLSQTMWELIAFRGLQGLGAGALFPIPLAVIGDLFTPAERGKYQASSVASSASPSWSDRSSAASSRTISPGTGSSSSTCPLGSSRCT